MKLQRPSLNPFKKQNISQIFLGIDFGTSYTKVSYSYAPTQNPQIHTIKWENDFFKQTILYIQNGKLCFDKPQGDSKEIKYFKYSIIESRLKNTSRNTKNNFEEICCIFFLAQIIKRSMQIVKEKLKIENIETIKVYINMGAPLENFYEEKNKNNKDLYQKILKNAILFANGCNDAVANLPFDQVSILKIDEIYSKMLQDKKEFNWTANVYPELAAELLLYHKSKFVADGVYAIIDIGGGTVDMALFQKMTSSHTKNSYMYCLAQKVLPYGIEILKTSPNSVSQKRFQEEFCSMLINSKGYMNVKFEEYKKIDVFFLGGGANCKWYSDSISETKNRLQKGGIPILSFSRSIEDFIYSEESLIQKNQRLIISQILAKHNNEIDDVRGFPNFYETEKLERPQTYFDKEEDLRKKGEKYLD